LRVAALIRCGELCASCRGGCNAHPDDFGNIEIECVACDGSGCERCHDGRVTITTCPKTLVDQTTLDVVRLCDARRDGILPIAGGLLDQSATAVQAMEFYLSDVNRIEADIYERNS
jgi:hypothetical protein